ncbi:ABC transporter ATP-binding protein [Halodesulfovibrio sp.]|uniref:ABC transporter ATP-binding protein n=1 Tax=Halodesulfovibrio sp. TaxID=1912772 RepID=UPI0025BAAED9|nr:ABC transporter ATP-binding protein [Halodesulfovibrio sp.]
MLKISSVQKKFDKKYVLSDVSLSLREGQIGCLLGASGCGKTTLLRIIAGFEAVDSGEVNIDKMLVSSDKKLTPSEERKIGMVFQDYALFPHLTVKDNIAFGLQQKRKRFLSASLSNADKMRISKMLSLVGLTESANKFPHQLSGGQQQRVALVRALAPKPKLLLLDEPFSNLDVTLRERLSLEMRSILKKEGITAVMVTHNQSEAFAMADTIGIMNEGKLHQWGTPSEVYHTPTTPFVATFIGEGELIKGNLSKTMVNTALGTFNKDCITFFPSHKNGVMLVRPEKICVSSLKENITEDAVKGIIEDVRFKGTICSCSVRLPSNEIITATVPNNTSLSQHDIVAVSFRN